MGMLLAIDVGNTQTVLGLYQGETLRKMWRVSTKTAATADEMIATLHGLFSMEGLAFKQVAGMVLATVVPEQKRLWCNVGQAAFGLQVLVVEAAHLAGLLDVRTQGSGADRLANAVAASSLYGAPVVVVDMGTATNMEVVDAQGAFLGGVIAPGIETSLRSLVKGTSLLPSIDIGDPKAAIGANTVDAIRIGVVLGEADRIDGLVRRIWAELGCECPVVATGGLSAVMGSLCSTVTVVNPELTLQGLQLIYTQAQPLE